MKSFISLEEAIEMLNENVKTMEVEEVQLIDAIDKVLAEDVYSLINNPPFNKSAMDGYAVMYEDTNESGKVLQIIDEVFAGDGISSFDDLVAKLNAGSDYENRENALNSYIAYHILNGARTLSAFQAYDNILEKKKLWGTRADSLILASEVNQICYLNDDGNGAGVTFVTEKANELVKNGYIQPIDGYLPIVSQEPVAFAFDF